MHSLTLVLSRPERRRQLVASLVPLSQDGVDCVPNAAAAVRSVGRRLYRLLIIDLDIAGALKPLREARSTAAGASVGALAFTSSKTDELVDEAFAAGVDDLIAWPCDAREFQARVRVILRRRGGFGAGEGPLALGGVRIDPGDRSCIVAGRHVKLQPREFQLLEVLMRREGRVLSRGYLLETVWGMSSEAATRAVDVMVSRLRRSLGDRAGSRIETVSKLGYCFRERPLLSR